MVGEWNGMNNVPPVRSAERDFSKEMIAAGIALLSVASCSGVVILI